MNTDRVWNPVICVNRRNLRIKAGWKEPMGGGWAKFSGQCQHPASGAGLEADYRTLSAHTDR